MMMVMMAMMMRSRVYDLRPAAAWNLALIYREAGNEDLAYSLLQRWCTLH